MSSKSEGGSRSRKFCKKLVDLTRNDPIIVLVCSARYGDTPKPRLSLASDTGSTSSTSMSVCIIVLVCSARYGDTPKPRLSLASDTDSTSSTPMSVCIIVLVCSARYGDTPKRRLSLASDSSTPTPLRPLVLDRKLSQELGETFISRNVYRVTRHRVLLLRSL